MIPSGERRFRRWVERHVAISAANRQNDYTGVAGNLHVRQRTAAIPAGVLDLHPLDFVVAAVHDDERHAGLPQLFRGTAAHAAESAQDEVSIEFVDHVLDTPLSEKLIQLQLDHRLGHGSYGQQENNYSEENQERIEDPSRVAERMDFAISHRGYGGQRHIERVEPGIILNEAES